MTSMIAPQRDDSRTQCIRGAWLLRASYLAAVGVILINIEVCGLLWSIRAVTFALSVEAICLNAIIIPLLVYLFRNGRVGVRYASREIALIGLVITISVVLNILAWIGVWTQ